MKKLILAFAALMMTAQAHAVSANLNTFQLQKDGQLAKRNIGYGSVEVDLQSRQMTVTFQPAFSCPAGKMCPMVMPPAIRFDAPLADAKRGGCNETVYTGTTESLMEDGTAVVVTVTDNSTNTCKYFVAIPGTEVKLELMVPAHGQPQETDFASGPSYLN